MSRISEIAIFITSHTFVGFCGFVIGYVVRDRKRMKF